ncbi:sulfatase-like hydrolase/transferase [Bacteroidales bacterium]|nr:sulfatase-like hydrolase/transferase [Bacteroidales bacterium]
MNKSCLFLIIGIMFSVQSFSSNNVLLIIADDLGIDYTPGYNSPLTLPSLPNIEQLANEGVTFLNTWSNPLCSPTRAGILTGKYGFRTRVGAPVGGLNQSLDLSESTLPELIDGHSTACIGKWHLSTRSNGGDDNPNLTGFDSYSGCPDGEVADYFSYTKVVNGTEHKVENYATTETVNDAMSWLDTVSSHQPWFLWLAFNAVHTPFHRPPDSLHNFDLLEYSDTATNKHEYFMAMIEAMDYEMGRLLTYLKNNNEYDSTTIIFVGDNGTLGSVKQEPFMRSRAKGTLFEGGVHVPMIVSGNKVLAKGRESTSLVNTVDIFNSALELCQVAPDVYSDIKTDSRSFVPVLQNELGYSREWLYSEIFGVIEGQTGTTIRNDDYHLIHFDDDTERLYNLQTDKYESVNLLNRGLSQVDQDNYDRLMVLMDSLLADTIMNSTAVEYSQKIISPQTIVFSTGNEIHVNTAGENFGNRLSIYNLLGKPVLNGVIKSEFMSYYIYTPGIYVVQIQQLQGIETYKVKVY